MQQGRLTTHVLDTTNGRPAAGLGIDLFQMEGNKAHMIASVVTNADGRCDQPLLEGEKLETGGYELLFNVGAYFSRLGLPDDNPFLEMVPVRFIISDPRAHYHVPLLVSPYGYSTYRGS